MRDSPSDETHCGGDELNAVAVARVALAALLLGLTLATEAQGDFTLKDSIEASVYRGSIVFHNYCVTCHGVNADGKGRAATLHTPRPANLRISPYSDAYKELIIRGGGTRVARSEFMPPWGEELTDQQIADVVVFLRWILAAPGK
jgi:mono/diheme cytochrome c family protein